MRTVARRIAGIPVTGSEYGDVRLCVWLAIIIGAFVGMALTLMRSDMPSGTAVLVGGLVGSVGMLAVGTVAYALGIVLLRLMEGGDGSR